MSTTEAIAEAMTNWNNLEVVARNEYPSATAEEIYQITKEAMNRSLGIDRATKVSGSAP